MQISYELCKQLKDAGFRWNGKGETKLFFNGVETNGPENESIYHPTLSELIEACVGNEPVKFGLMQEYSSKSGTSWHAYVDFPKLVTADAKTPEESVMKLWLKLHDRKD